MSSQYFWTCYCSPILLTVPSVRARAGWLLSLTRVWGILCWLIWITASAPNGICAQAHNFCRQKHHSFLFTVELLLLYHEVDKNIILLCIEIFNTVFHLTLVFPLKKPKQRFVHVQALKEGDHLVWDKDNRFAMDFVAACANIRSKVFGIAQKSRFDIKCE